MDNIKEKLQSIGDLEDLFHFGQEASFLDKDDPNILLGIECFKECIKHDYEPFISRYFLAIIYSSIGEYEKEYELYDELINREDLHDYNDFEPILCNVLGKMNCEGKGTDFNPEKGYGYLIRGTEVSKMIDNIIGIGDCYLNGWHVEKDYSKALEKYQEALNVSYEYPRVITNDESSRAFALCRIGKCFLYGYGIEKDPYKAYEYLDNAHNMGCYLTADSIEDYELAKKQMQNE
jgi:tetratricopeptide (TPR) repeat protein